MPNDFSQAERQGRLRTPLPADTLLLTEFTGTEAVNDISLFRVRAFSVGPVDLDKILGKGMSVEIDGGYDQPRQFHQIVFSGRIIAFTQDSYSYEFELRPWIWAASRRETSRIFEKKTVEKIIETVLGEYTQLPGASFEFKLRKRTPELEYTVQYRETDLNFVLRLLEEYGINYHFKMGQDTHKMVMSDSIDGFVKVEGNGRALHGTEDVVLGEESLNSWLPQRTFTTGKVALRDYDFKNSAKLPKGESNAQRDYKLSALESFDYPGRFTTDADAMQLATRRALAFRTTDAQVRTSGDSVSLGAGMLVLVSGAEPADQNGSYACLSAHHHYTDGSYGGRGQGNSYEGSYLLTSEDAPIAPARVTPKAVVRGPQTAKVVLGAEEAVDEWGRIKVKFHWDRSDAETSMYCRVSQMWAGSGWGTVFIPRKDMEVVVEFLEGDPDRPLIVGSVYNDKNMPPWELPKEKTKSGIKTKTHGSGKGYNELSFNDEGGKELIEMHGQKDLKVVIENNEDHEIKKDSKRKIGGDRKDDITGTLTQTVTGDIIIESKAKMTLKVGGSSIVMDSSSITIESLNIEIKGSAGLKTNGGGTAEHKTGGMMTISGSMVKIN